MSQPPPSNVNSTGNSTPGSTSSNQFNSDSSKFNFVDMTKDVEFKTRNKGDKSLKVNKQFRYNKRFQNNFFIFKTGQQPNNSSNDPINQFSHDLSIPNYYYHQAFDSNQAVTGMNLANMMDENNQQQQYIGAVHSTSTNPLTESSNNSTTNNQYRVRGRYAKRTNTTSVTTTPTHIPPYITNSETFNLLNSNAQLMMLMGSSFNQSYQHANNSDPSLIDLMHNSSHQSIPQEFNQQINNQSYFLPEEEEYHEQDYGDTNQFINQNIPVDEFNSRKSFVTRSNSFTISPIEMNSSNTVNRAMSAPTIVFEKVTDQSPNEEDTAIWLEDKTLKPTINKKRQRKSFLFNSSSSSSSSGVSSSESSVQNSNSNSPNTLNNNGDNLLAVVTNEVKKKSSSPQYKKKNIQQEQFELEFLESNPVEESRDELDMLLDSIILENNNQFN